MNQPEIITSQDRWEAIANELAGVAEFSVDTESNSMHAYRGRICLVQLSWNSSICLLDPLAVSDLSSLGSLLGNNTITKLMHGADYDLRCFFREYGFETKGLFDTEVCARFCGMVAPNLAATLLTYLEVDIPKSRRLQRSNWALRPLTGEAREYAASDVMHLAPLAGEFRRRLGALGRMDWVHEEFARMERAGAQATEPVGPAYLRLKGSDRLDPQQLAVLSALFELRESEAERVDVPPYRVLGNDTLLHLAREPHSALEEAPGMPPQLVRRSGNRIRAEIQRALRGPGVERPVSPRRNQPPSKSAQRRIQALKLWRTEKGAELGLDPSLLWPAASLERLARDPSRWAEEGEAVDNADVRAWQRKEFARELREVLHSAVSDFPP